MKQHRPEIRFAGSTREACEEWTRIHRRLAGAGAVTIGKDAKGNVAEIHATCAAKGIDVRVRVRNVTTRNLWAQMRSRHARSPVIRISQRNGRTRSREHRPAATRRTSSSSSTSSSDPGDGDPEQAAALAFLVGCDWDETQIDAAFAAWKLVRR